VGLWCVIPWSIYVCERCVSVFWCIFVWYVCCFRYLFLGDDGNRMWCLCRAFVCVKMSMCVLCRSVWGICVGDLCGGSVWGSMFLCVCSYNYELFCMCVDACVSMGLDWVSVGVGVSVCVYVDVCVYVYICMCVYVYVCVCVCVCVWMRTRIDSWSTRFTLLYNMYIV